MKALPLLVAALTTLAFGFACASFVHQPTLATFADDSVSYLVMAQVFSPWQAASPAVAAAFAGEATYPPLFPLVLALVGAAHDIAWAHVLTALILAAALPLAWLLGARWLESRGAAAGAVLALALLPALWINAMGILSEPLFCVLLLGIFLSLESERKRPWLAALLMAGMLLTRAAALVPVLAYAGWVLTRKDSWKSKLHAAAPALVAIVAYAAWMLVRPAATTDSYARILLDNAAALGSAGDPWSVLGGSVVRRLNAMFEGWLGSLLVFWVEGRPVRTALAGGVGLLALAGMVLRIRAGKPDGWMTAAYLAMYLVWPFYDQMGRFLFPLLPVFVLYSFHAAGRALAAARRPAALGHALAAILAVSLALPALGFVYQRASTGYPAAAIVDWYRTADVKAAKTRAQVHLDLFADMEAIRKLTRPGESVMWVAPGYIALLADRHGVKAPDSALGTDPYLEAARKLKVDYVFMSTYHPRDTLSDAAWRASVRAFAHRAQVRVAKVAHMHVVAHAGAVAGREIAAVDLDRLAPAGGRLQHERDQVRLGLVALAEASRRIGAGGVEIAQADRAQAVPGVRGIEHALDGELGGAVGIDRQQGMRLVDRHGLRLAVDRGARGTHHLPDACRTHRAQQRLGLDHVVALVFPGVGDRLADQAEGGEMDHGADLFGREQRFDPRLVADVGLDKARARHCVAVPGRQIVQHYHAVAALEEQLHHVRADVAGAAGDQDVHRAPGGMRPVIVCSARICHRVSRPGAACGSSCRGRSPSPCHRSSAVRPPRR
jgi:hypothetical protein